MGWGDKYAHVKLFDGQPNHLRPHYSALACSSGLLKVLEAMIIDSILQDGIGFPHLMSHFSYWYIAAGEEAALEYVSMDDDVGENVKNFVTMVSFISRFYYML